MPCFSCLCFSDGKGRHGEKLSGGRGYCELRDQEYWRGHECGSYAPVWYRGNSIDSPLVSRGSCGFFDLFRRKNSVVSPAEPEAEISVDTHFCEEDCENAEEIQPDIASAFTELPASPQPDKLPQINQLNIAVDDTVFQTYGLRFQCHPSEEYGTLKLNFELFRTRRLASKMERGDIFTIKANAYDSDGCLLCIEEALLEYRQLKSNYAADYFYFSAVSMDRVCSIRVYAVDPTEDTDAYEDCPSEPNTVSDTQAMLLDEALAARLQDILDESLQLMRNTVHPQTFFGRYKDAIFYAAKIAETTHTDAHRAYAEEVVSDLKNHRCEQIKEFIDRCHARKKLASIKEELLSDRYDLPAELIFYIEDLVCAHEIPHTDCPERCEYLYCSLSFHSHGKTYYYKTTDETLKCGDDVIVIVGKEGRKSIARIEKIERFSADQVPYPPHLTKDILGKCPY